MNWKSNIQKIRMNISCAKAHLVSRCLAMTDHPMLLTYHGHLRFCIVQPHPPQSHIIKGFLPTRGPQWFLYVVQSPQEAQSYMVKIGISRWRRAAL